MHSISFCKRSATIGSTVVIIGIDFYFISLVAKKKTIKSIDFTSLHELNTFTAFTSNHHKFNKPQVLTSQMYKTRKKTKFQYVF